MWMVDFGIASARATKPIGRNSLIFPTNCQLLLVLRDGSMITAKFFQLSFLRYGRLSVTIGCHIVSALAGLGANFSVGILTFGLSRLLVGAVVISQSLCFYVLVMESIDANNRLMVSTGFLYTYSISGALVIWGAYFIREWRIINALITIPLLIIPCISPFLIESPRWMISQNRCKQAKLTLTEIAKMNKKSKEYVASLEFSSWKEAQNKETNFLRVFKFPHMRRIILLTNFTWILHSIGYTGGYIYASVITDKPFIMITINIGLDILSNLFAERLSERFGRRSIFISSGLVSGLAYASTVALNSDSTVSNMALLMVGRFSLIIGYNINYLYAAEVFPTSIRSQAMSIRQALGSAGGFLSTQIVQLGLEAHSLPLLVFGASSIIVAITSLWLPETKGLSLLETIEEGEQRANDMAAKNSCPEKKKTKDIIVTRF